MSLPAEGTVATVRGRVRKLDALLEAPLSGASCVAFAARAFVSERGRFVGPVAATTPVDSVDRVDASEHAAVPFAVETAHGLVLVADTQIELLVGERSVIPRKMDRERAFLTRHHSPTLDLRRISFGERRVLPGDRIAVRGAVTYVIVPGESERLFRDAAARVRIVAAPRRPISIRPQRWWEFLRADA